MPRVYDQAPIDLRTAGDSKNIATQSTGVVLGKSHGRGGRTRHGAIQIASRTMVSRYACRRQAPQRHTKHGGLLCTFKGIRTILSRTTKT